MNNPDAAEVKKKVRKVKIVAKESKNLLFIPKNRFIFVKRFFNMGIKTRKETVKKVKKYSFRVFRL